MSPAATVELTPAVVTTLLLAAVVYLLVKHAIADFFLQTAFQWRNKGAYGHPGGLVHVAIHAVLTLPVFLILRPRTAAAAAGVLLLEAVLHYHIDWLKDRLVKRQQWTAADDSYWRALGLDQMLHGLTYAAMIWLLAHASFVP
jgi:Protein of unknown function (DUF3307)